MFARVLNYLYGYERLRHRGDRLFLAGEFERARTEYTRARSMLSSRDYRSSTLDALIRECEVQARGRGRASAVPSSQPLWEDADEPESDETRGFYPGLEDLFELAIGEKGPDRIGFYRAMNDDFKAGYVALVQANPDRAVRFLSASAASPSASFVTHLELGRAHSLGGDMIAAREALKRAERSAPDDTEVVILVSAVNIELGRYEEAKVRLQRLADAGVDSPDVKFLLGRALAGLGRDERALEKFRETVAAEPNFHEAFFEASMLLGKRGDRDAQFRLLSRACALAPDEVRYNRELAELVLAENFDEEAGLAACDRLMVTDEDNAWQYLFWIAQLYVRRGWKREARDPLEKALRLVPPEQRAERRQIEAFLGALS